MTRMTSALKRGPARPARGRLSATDGCPRRPRAPSGAAGGPHRGGRTGRRLAGQGMDHHIRGGVWRRAPAGLPWPGPPGHGHLNHPGGPGPIERAGARGRLGPPPANPDASEAGNLNLRWAGAGERGLGRGIRTRVASATDATRSRRLGAGAARPDPDRRRTGGPAARALGSDSESASRLGSLDRDVQVGPEPRDPPSAGSGGAQHQSSPATPASSWEPVTDDPGPDPGPDSASRPLATRSS